MLKEKPKKMDDRKPKKE